MEDELYDAAVAGELTCLEKILTGNPNILHRIAARNFISTPLHMASSLGYDKFVEKLLENSPDLAGVLDQRRRSALHLAAEKGHMEVVKSLLKLEEHRKEMCMAVDDEGRNPLHVAAMNGQHEILKEMIKMVGSEVAHARVKNGRTILHLCVLYRQKDTLKKLMGSERQEPINAVDEWGNTILMGSGCQELINAVDEWGNTILHLAVADRQDEMVKYIVDFKGRNHEKMNLNVKNLNDCTALDILIHNKEKDETISQANTQGEAKAKTKVKEIRDLLLHKKVKEKTIAKADTDTKEAKRTIIMDILLKQRAKRGKDLTNTEWLAEKRESLMIVTILIAAMAFQAGVSPPGGVWQDNTAEHRAGETVMAYTYHHYYPYFVRANTIGFVASSSTILLLLSDLPFRKKTFMWFLVLVMWLSITSMAFTYAFAITVITPKENRKSLTRTIVVAVIVWIAVMSILLLIHTFRLVKSLIVEELDNRREYGKIAAEYLAQIGIRMRSQKRNDGIV